MRCYRGFVFSQEKLFTEVLLLTYNLADETQTPNTMQLVPVQRNSGLRIRKIVSFMQCSNSRIASELLKMASISLNFYQYSIYFTSVTNLASNTKEENSLRYGLRDGILSNPCDPHPISIIPCASLSTCFWCWSEMH